MKYLKKAEECIGYAVNIKTKIKITVRIREMIKMIFTYFKDNYMKNYILFTFLKRFVDFFVRTSYFLS